MHFNNHVCDLQRVPKPSLLHTALMALVKVHSADPDQVRQNVAGVPDHLKNQLINYIVECNSSILTVNDLLAFSSAVGDKRESSLQYLDLLGPVFATLQIEELSSSRLTFPFLTHLCLARQGPSALSPISDWISLLCLTSETPNLTSLSLANWSAPQLPPKERTVKSRKDDWETLAICLKHLTKSLPHLLHLNLEGCHSWNHALRWTFAVDWKNDWQYLQRLTFTQPPMGRTEYDNCEKD